MGDQSVLTTIIYGFNPVRPSKAFDNMGDFPMPHALSLQPDEDTFQAANSQDTVHSGDYFSHRPVTNGRLRKMLMEIAKKSPTGSVFLDQALANGTKFKSYKRAKSDDPLSYFDPEKNTV